MTPAEQCAKLMRETWGPIEDPYVEQFMEALNKSHARLVSAIYKNMDSSL